MEITINQQFTEVSENHSVQQLLLTFFTDIPNGIAVAVNTSVIPKSQWTEHIILPNDDITIIRATQGG